MNPYQPGEDNQDPYEVGYKAGAASRDVEIAELVAALEDAQWDEDGWKLKVANLLAKVRKPE